MNFGISTGCLYPMLTENCITELINIGFNSFEIFFNTFSELEYDYLDKLKFNLNKNNASVKSIHPFTSGYESYLLFSNYERRFIDGLHIYEMYFRAAKYLGAKKVILHGLYSDFKTSLSDKTYFDRFRILSECAGQYGIEFLQENVNLFRSNNIDFIKNMRNYIFENAKFVLDIKQANLGGISPVDMLNAIGSSLRHIHISDFSANNKCLLPGQGCFNYEEFFEKLKKIGFDDDIIIEVYRFSFDKIEELKKSLDFLKDTLNKI